MTRQLRGTIWTDALFAAPVLLYAMWLHQGWGGQFVARTVDDVGLLVFAAVAAICSAAAAARTRARLRSAWTALTVGLSGWAVGEAIWSYYELSGARQTPFPSVADVGFLLFPAGAATALLLFPSGHSAHARVRMILDGALVAGSLFVASWVTALGSVYRAGADGRLAFGVSLAYPIADLITVTMTVLIVARAQAHRTALGLLGTGIVLMGIADSGFAYLTATGAYRSGNMVDLGWAAAFGVLARAARSTTPAEPDEQRAVVPGRVRVWLPYVPSVLVGAIGGRQFMPSLHSGPMPAVGLLLVLTLLVRQLIVLAENRRLLVVVTAQAFRDPLTGLVNRALFVDRLTRAAARRQRVPAPFSVLMLDVDRFKQINDTLGHAAGDQLLVQIGERLNGALRATDTIARLGGDEFAVIIEDDAATARSLAVRVTEAFSAPFVLDGNARSVRPSVGLATASADETDICVDDLLKEADHAMYTAKRAGGGIHVSSPRPIENRRSELSRAQPFNVGVLPEQPASAG